MFSSPRAWAFTLLGIHEYLRGYPTTPAVLDARALLTGELVRLWKDCATEKWPWFEPSATYDNARLCQALILELRGHFQGLTQDFARPAKVLLLEGDLAELL